MVADQRTARWKISACLSSVTSPFLCTWGAVAAGARLSRGGRRGHRACMGQAASGDCKHRTKERPLAAPSPFTCGHAPGHSTQAPLPAHGLAGWHRAHPVLPAGCSPRSPPEAGLVSLGRGALLQGPPALRVQWAGEHPASRWAPLPSLLGTSSTFGCSGTSCGPLAMGRGH